MRPFSVLVLAAVVAVSGAGEALLLRSRSTSTGAAGEALVVNDEELQLPEGFGGQLLKHSFRIRNSMPSEVMVSRLQTSCTCSTISPESFAISPGSSQIVTADLRLPVATSRQNVEVSISPIVVSAKDRTLVWRLKGVVIPIGTFDTRSIDFGKVIKGRQTPAANAREVVFSPHPSIEKIEVSGDTPFVQSRVRRREGGEYSIVVQPHSLDEGSIGWHAVHLDVTGQSRGGVQLGRDVIEVRWRVCHIVEVEPPSMSLGLREVNSTATVDLAFSSSQSEVTSVSPLGKDRDACVVAKSETLDGSRLSPISVEVSQLIQHRGNWHGRMAFVATLADGTQHTVVLPVSYWGVE